MSAVQEDATPFLDTLQASHSPAIPAQAMQSFRQGLGCLQAGEAATAVAALSRSLESAPDFAPGHMFLGIAYALTSSVYPAIHHMEKAAELDQNSFAAQFTLAQLNFKLRIPQKGYEAAERARRCIGTLEHRKMLTNLLKEERSRERNGMARPCFNKPFSRPALFLAGSGLLAAIIAILIHMS
jgi:tetratricopeptide (TPR) repeat protein